MHGPLSIGVYARSWRLTRFIFQRLSNPPYLRPTTGYVAPVYSRQTRVPGSSGERGSGGVTARSGVEARRAGCDPSPSHLSLLGLGRLHLTMFRPAFLLRRCDTPACRRAKCASRWFLRGGSGCGAVRRGSLIAFQLSLDFSHLFLNLLSFVSVSDQRHLEHGPIFCASSSWHRFSPGHYNKSCKAVSISCKCE